MTVEKFYIPQQGDVLQRPYFSVSVSAGFPSPADDHMDRNLDLNALLIKHPSATFFVRVSGDSMVGAGIHDGDILVVDKALTAKDGSVVVAIINGEFTVKRIKKKDGNMYLWPENVNYKPILVTDAMDFEVWGVVRSVVHSLL